MNKNENYLNRVFFKSSSSMSEVPDNTVNLIVTSPPYFNIKDYSLDGYQIIKHSENHSEQLGDIDNYQNYINELLKIWKECHRVLVPNGKLIVNVPLMPMLKSEMKSHYNRHIYDLNSEIQHSIIHNTKFYLYDTYIWNRTNPSKKLMFGSYPYPRNFYAQNTVEFITVYVKDGIPINNIPDDIKERSKLSQKEWIEFTKQIWNIPIPSKGDLAFGKHPAIMPEEIVFRCIKLFTFVNDVVLDPFAGSGTTLKVAQELDRNFIGYEVMKSYESIINAKLGQQTLKFLLAADSV